MHRPQLITWFTHSREHTTLLGQHTLKSQHNSTRLQEALPYTALHYTYMCNIVTEFYLYSIVYIYLINSRLDVTSSVHHHFCTATLSWCQISGKNSRNRRENLTVIELMHNNNNNAGKFKEEFTHTHSIFKRLFKRTLNIQTSSETISYDHSILEM